MSALSVADPRVHDLALAIGALRVTARSAPCRSCRSADASDCQAEAERCCEECDHSLPQAAVAAQTETIHHALGVIIREEGSRGRRLEA